MKEEIVHMNKYSSQDILPYDEYIVEMKTTDNGEPHVNVIHNHKTYKFMLKNNINENKNNELNNKVYKWFDSINEMTDETYLESCQTIWDIFHP